MNKKRIPTYHVASIFDVTPESLIKRGYKVIFTDLDNTLECYKVSKPSEMVSKKIKEFKDAGLEIFIISNNFKGRVTTYAEAAGVEMRYLMLKPFRFKLKRLLKEKNLNPREVIMVGDQLFTDISGGNAAKIDTLLVDPLTKTDQPFTSFKRKLERPLLKKMKDRNLLREWEDNHEQD